MILEIVEILYVKIVKDRFKDVFYKNKYVNKIIYFVFRQILFGGVFLVIELGIDLVFIYIV